MADVFIVWAKCDDDKVRGFILEKVSRSIRPRRQNVPRYNFKDGSLNVGACHFNFNLRAAERPGL